MAVRTRGLEPRNTVDSAQGYVIRRKLLKASRLVSLTFEQRTIKLRRLPPSVQVITCKKRTFRRPLHILICKCSLLTLLFETELHPKGKSTVKNVEDIQNTNRKAIFGNPQLSLVYCDDSLLLIHFEIKKVENQQEKQEDLQVTSQDSFLGTSLWQRCLSAQKALSE